MQLIIAIENEEYTVNVPDFVLDEAQDYFDMMDQDMAKGYQMSRTWVQEPDLEQRCQIAADKLYTALHTEKKDVGMLMAGYILARMPNVQRVVINPEGDMMEHALA